MSDPAPSDRSGPELHAHAVGVLLALYLVEVSLLTVLVGVYKVHAYDLHALLTGAGITAAAGVVGLVCSLWFLRSRVARSDPGRAVGLALGTNLLTVVLVLVAAETGLRLVATNRAGNVVIGSTLLAPTWQSLVQQSRDVIAHAAPWDSWDSSYFVFDPELGWTVGTNRQTPDGLYFSSIEGVRSPGPDLRMVDETRPYRVALIGDSNAFSFEVPYEESWGHYLEQLLGRDAQVLNFGVDGYGLDQICLRYERDVQQWAADVVVLGFVGHDLRRSLAVYPFVSFGWPGYVVKPRMVIDDQELRIVNVPLPEPESVLGASGVHELPFVDYDLGFATQDWTWRSDGMPLAVRFLTTRFPRWPAVDPRFSPEATRELNVRILDRLITAIEGNGSVPVVVLLSESRDHLDQLAQEVLAAANVPFLRVDECVSQVPAEFRLVASGNHYTGLANRAIAQCTAPAIQDALSRVGGRRD